MQFVPHTKLNDDTFIIKLENDSNLLYAPLRRRAAVISNETVSDIISGTEAGNNLMQTEGFAQSKWAIPPTPADGYYSPSTPGNIMISVTSKCNLRCAYCFADGGEYHEVMPWNVVQAFLDFVPAAARKNNNAYSVSFHGDGETLTEPDLTFKICDALQDLAKKHEFRLNISLTTNGTLINEDNIDMIKKYFNHIGISFDGDDIAQGENRPFPSGSSSYGKVLAAVTLLKEHNISYSIRATVTKNSVTRLPEMVNFVADYMLCNNVHFEPATACNRAGENLTPDPKEFIKAFKKAKLIAYSRGIVCFSSLQRPDNLSQIFCSTSNAGMTLLADGTITACSRVTHPEDEFISKYVIGRYKTEIDAFEFYPEVITNLRTKTVVSSYSECENCFAKWHCSGVCPANRDRGSVPYLCEITQHLTLDAIMTKHKNNQFLNQVEAIERVKQKEAAEEAAKMD